VPPLDTATIERALARFVGVIRQVPPMYSALHRDGKRLYELARQGVTVEREPREVRIDAIALEAIATPDLTLRVRCGKGAYIRALAADVGAALGCGATLARLVRTRVGPYGIDGCVSWLELRDARDGQPLWDRVLPPDSALASLSAVSLDARQARAFAHGQAVAVASDRSGPVRVYDQAGSLLGIGVCRGALVKPERLLHADPPRTPVVSG
jgi:tRNA pseudouridine55 synthase